MTTIILSANGPDSTVVTVPKNSSVTFQNNLACNTTVTSEPGLFPQIGNGLFIAQGASASATVSGAASSGKKYYYEGCGGPQAPREGIIDVS